MDAKSSKQPRPAERRDCVGRVPRVRITMPGRNRIIVRLTTGVELGLAPRDVEGLQHASAEDLKVIEVVNTVPAFDIKSSPVLCCDACEQP
jgi:hypothetical protein